VYILLLVIYTVVDMTKRLVDIEDETLEAAQRVLGTSTIKDTVNTALRESVRAAERRQHVDVEALKRFAEAAKDLADEDVMADAWR
jgi:Arc/MetJ family transcription regulator